MFFKEAMFNRPSFSNRSTGETEVVLNQENCTFESLIKCSDLLNQYRNWNPKIIEFFSKEENIKSMFTFIVNAHNRKDFNSVRDLFKTSNPFLNRIFADSIPLCNCALENINNRNIPCYQYASATFLLLINLSYKDWPKEVHELLQYSDVAYKILIENIDQDCVFVFIHNLIIDSYPISEFIWHLFRAMSKINRQPPHVCFLAENKEVPDISNLRLHKLNAILIIKKYFELGLPMNEDFQEIVMNYISDEVSKNDDYPAFLDLALIIGPNDRFEQIVYQKLSNAIQKSNVQETSRISFYIAKWISYLAICAKANKNHLLTDEIVINFVITFLKENVFDYILQQLVELVDNYLTYLLYSKSNSLRAFVDQLKNILLSAWNQFQDNNPTISPFILSLSMVTFKQYRLSFSEQIRDELPKPFLLTLQNWENKEFIESV